MATFYTVFNPDGLAPAKVKHPTHKAAFHAAGQMAAMHPGQRFYVMRRASRKLLVEVQLADEHNGEGR